MAILYGFADNRSAVLLAFLINDFAFSFITHYSLIVTFPDFDENTKTSHGKRKRAYFDETDGAPSKRKGPHHFGEETIG